MKIFNDIQKNAEKIKEIMSIPLSIDAIFREFSIYHNNKEVKAFLVYYEGVASGPRIDEFVLQSLHLVPKISNSDLKSEIASRLISANQLSIKTNFEDVMQIVNYGGCAVFADGVDVCYVADVKGWERRGISEPVAENVIRGSQEAFIETMRINTAHNKSFYS